MAGYLRIEYSGPINAMTTKAALAAVLLHAPAVTGLDQDPLEVKLPAHMAGLPGRAVASRMRANEISFLIVTLIRT